MADKKPEPPAGAAAATAGRRTPGTGQPRPGAGDTSQGPSASWRRPEPRSQFGWVHELRTLSRNSYINAMKRRSGPERPAKKRRDSGSLSGGGPVLPGWRQRQQHPLYNVPPPLKLRAFGSRSM